MPTWNENEIEVTTPPASTDKAVVDTASVYYNPEIPDIALSHVEGTPYNVTYYGQFINKDDIVSNSDDIASSALKQYQKSYNLEFRLSGDLSHSTDATTGTSVLTGEANVVPILVPIVGDLFLGEIESGVRGVFEITSVTKSSHYKMSIWKVTFTLVSYLSNYNLSGLNEKVIVTLVYDPTYLNHAGGPLLTLSQNDRNITREEMIAYLVDRYYEKFYNANYQTFVLINDDKVIYDPFVTDFFNKITPDVYTERYERAMEYDVKGTIFTHPFSTVYDIIIDRNVHRLSSTVKQMAAINKSSFTNTRVYNTLRATTIDKIVYPTSIGGLSISNTDTPEEYIFTSHFYKGVVGDMTDFEKLVYRFMSKEKLPFIEVSEIYSNLESFELTDQFNIIPILILLLRESI